MTIADPATTDPATTETIRTTVETSPAGDTRDHSVLCFVCRTPTFNHSARCDRHRKRCAICGTPIRFGNWCSKLCWTEDEGRDDHPEIDV